MRKAAKRRAGITAGQWKELLGLWAQRVRSRAGGRCERCGSTEVLQCHHVFTKRIPSMRVLLLNGVLLCRGCHFWWHEAAQGGEQWTWFCDKYGQERLASLHEIRNAGKRPDYEDLKSSLL